MPRRLRKSKRRPVGLPDHELQVLCKGIPARRSDPGFNFMCDIDAQRSKWKQHRDEVLAWWIATRPGSRPFAWWAFESPEPRRRTVGLEGAEREAEIERLNEAHPGRPYKDDSLDRGIPRNKLWSDVYETEQAYLSRLGLLSPEEAERCHAS